MKYLKEKYWKIILLYLFIIVIDIITLKTVGTGFKPTVFHDGSGPLSWNEIYESYRWKILIFSLIPTLLGTYLGYWDWKKKNEE